MRLEIRQEDPLATVHVPRAPGDGGELSITRRDRRRADVAAMDACLGGSLREGDYDLVLLAGGEEIHRETRNV